MYLPLTVYDISIVCNLLGIKTHGIPTCTYSGTGCTIRVNPRFFAYTGVILLHSEKPKFPIKRFIQSVIRYWKRCNIKNYCTWVIKAFVFTVPIPIFSSTLWTCKYWCRYFSPKHENILYPRLSVFICRWNFRIMSTESVDICYWFIAEVMPSRTV